MKTKINVSIPIDVRNAIALLTNAQKLKIMLGLVTALQSLVETERKFIPNYIPAEENLSNEEIVQLWIVRQGVSSYIPLLKFFAGLI